MALAARYLPELEGLRGVAMLWVVAFHIDGLINLLTGRPTHGEIVSPWWALIRAGGDIGVDMFFVLSSFLLSLPFLQAQGPLSVRRFFAKRALRILPLYYALVVVGAVLSATRLADLARALPYFAFLNAVPGLTHPLEPFSNVWWSLVTEWEFYCVLPLAATLCRTPIGRRAAWLGLAGWAVAYAAWSAGWFGPHTLEGRFAVSFSLFGRAPSFLGGALVAWLFLRRGSASPTSASVGRTLLGDAVIIGLFLALGRLVGWSLWFGLASQLPPWHAYHLLQSALCSGVLAVVVLMPTHFAALLRHSVLLRLGVLSYSMYMVHMPVVTTGLWQLHAAGLTQVGQGWNSQGVLAAALVFTACVVVSQCTYRFVERPFLVRKETLAG